MLRLIDPMQGLPGGWKYIFPETGYEIKAASFASLANKAISHSNANGISTDEIINKLEDYSCRQLPADEQGKYCAQDGSPLIPKSVPTQSDTPCNRGCGGKREK